MGKNEQQFLPQSRDETQNRGSSGTLCQGCSIVLRRITSEFSFKCLFVLILSLSVLFSGIFWILPRHTIKTGFDANAAIKLSATVQAYFRLEKPVSQLIPYIERLEYDIYSEISVPNTKVAVLSMHQSGAPNLTDVVFGVLSDSMNDPINPAYLSLLRSLFIELFLQQCNLTLTTSIFGNASTFEVFKFYGGITVIPLQSTSIWQIPQIPFNFILNNSISEVLDNFADFKDELKFGLSLTSDEDVYVLQITNMNGSTLAPPVIVQASVTSAFGGLQPQRLKQLAQTIAGSRSKNLGLNNSVFGKVKEVRLSNLNSTLDSTSPSPSPAPSPQLIDHADPSISPYHDPSYPPTSPPTAEEPPCFDCDVSSPAPSSVTEHPPDPCPYSGFASPPSFSPNSYSNPSFPPDHSPSAAAPTSHFASPITELTPDLSPVAEEPHGSRPSQGKRDERLVFQSLAPSPISSAGDDFHREIMLLGFSMLLIYSFFCFSL